MIQSLACWLGMMVERGSCVIVVRVVDTQGSTPRDNDALMMVTRNTTRGTIGGGALEWTAIEHAREMIAGRDLAGRISIPLGPFIGQCCGGHVTLDCFQADMRFAQVLADREAMQAAMYPKVLVFGAGHVGKAIAQALAPLPFSFRILDTRAEEIAGLPPGIVGEIIEDPVSSVEQAGANSFYLILTHSHTIDFLVAEAALKRSDAAYVGMIGSTTKRARFKSWLKGRGTDLSLYGKLVCPIGGSRVRDKRPEVIAALVAAELIAKVHCDSHQKNGLPDQPLLQLVVNGSSSRRKLHSSALRGQNPRVGCARDH